MLSNTLNLQQSSALPVQPVIALDCVSATHLVEYVTKKVIRSYGLLFVVWHGLAYLAADCLLSSEEGHCQLHSADSRTCCQAAGSHTATSGTNASWLPVQLVLGKWIL